MSAVTVICSLSDGSQPDRSSSHAVPLNNVVGRLRCLVINLLHSVNRVQYPSACQLAIELQRAIRLAELRLTQLAHDVERATQMAQLSAVLCSAQHVLRAAPKSDGRMERQKSWKQRRRREGPMLAIYEDGELLLVMSKT